MTARGAAALVLLALVARSSGAQAAVSLPSGYRLPNPPGKCDCTNIPTTNAPVCGSDLSTYGNECIAQCANILIISDGVCPLCNIQTNDCQCGNIPYSPVCGFGLTWTSKCDALCGGYSCPLTPGVCEYNDKGSFTATSGGKSSASGAKAAATDSSLPDPTSASYDYAEGLHKTLIFFESMRSGILDRQRLAWRGDSCSGCKGPNGEDVSGGYYEAGGSFLKLGLVESFLVTLLGWSIDTFPQGFAKGDLQNAIDAMDWGAQYLVKAHSAPNRFVAVVGNSTLDFNYYGPVEEYEQYVKSRPSCYIDQTNKGSEIAGEAAAGLAAAYVVLKGQKASATKLASYLQHSQQLYELAVGSPGSYQDLTDPCLAQHGMLYKSTGYEDELAWAAAWLYKATGDQQYLVDARQFYSKTCQGNCYSFETGEKGPALNVFMASIDPSNASIYNKNAKAFFTLYLDQVIPYTPGGLAYPYHWGAFRPATQAAFLALVESKQLRSGNGDAAYAANLFNWAQYQINYVLGDSGRSWLAGFGKGYPTYIWHKPSYNSYIDWPTRNVTIFANWTAQQTDNTYKNLVYAPLAKFDMEGSRTPQRFIPYGALYGAPLQDDGIPNTRKDFTYAEATTDGTSGITGALAALTEYYATSPTVTKQDDCGLDLGWTHPNATNTAKSINNTAVCLGLPATAPSSAPKPTARPARPASVTASANRTSAAGPTVAAASPADAPAPAVVAASGPTDATPVPAPDTSAAPTPAPATTTGSSTDRSGVSAPAPAPSASPVGARLSTAATLVGGAVAVVLAASL